MTPEERAGELIELYWDGLLSESERRELETLLAGNDAARRLFLESSRLHAVLRLALKPSEGGESEALPRKVSGRRLRRGPARRGFPVLVLGAAAVLVFGVLGIVVSTRPKSAGPTVTRSVESPEAPVPPPAPPPPAIIPDPAPRPAEVPPPVPPPTPEVRPPERTPAPVREPVPPNPVSPPPAPVPAPPGETRVAVARLKEVTGEVRIVTGSERIPAEKGGPLLTGQGVDTGASGSGAAVEYEDGTRLGLMAETSIANVRTQQGKRLSILSGTVVARVPRQPQGEPMVFATPHGEMTVLGTSLRVAVDPAQTRLEVTEGRVRLKRALDGKTVDVAAGQFAVASARGEFAARPIPTALEILVARMEPGTWAELQTEGFGERLLSVGAGQSVLMLAEEAVWDPVDRQLHALGHTAPDATRHVVYDEKTNAWKGLPQTAVTGLGNAYDHLALDPRGRKLYFRPYNGTVVQELDLGGGGWRKLPPMPWNPTIIGALEFFPEAGGLIFTGGGFVYLLPPGAQQWKTLAQNLSMAGYNNFAEVDPVRKVMIFGGGNGTRELYRMDAAGKIVKLREAPIGLGQLDAVVVADPGSGRFLVLSRKEDARFYEFDAILDRWTALPAPPAPAVRLPRGSQTAAAPLGTHGVAVYLTYNFDDSKVYVYKPVKRGSK